MVGIALSPMLVPQSAQAGIRGNCQTQRTANPAVGVNDARQWWLGSPNFPAGYPVQAHRDLALSDMKALGAARLGLLADFDLSVIDENGDGNADSWTFPDALLLTAAQTNVSVLPLLRASVLPDTTTKRLAFARIAAAVIRRYKAGGTFWAGHPTVTPRPITAIAIWNEQNVASMFAGSMADYGKLVGQVWAQTQLRSPGFPLVSGGMAEQSTNGRRPFRWLQIAMRSATAEISTTRPPWSMIEGIGIHLYGAPTWTVARATRNYDRLWTDIERARGMQTPRPQIWVTEFGWRYSTRPSKVRNTYSASEITKRYALFLNHIRTTYGTCGPIYGYNLRMGNSGNPLDDGFGYFGTTGTTVGDDATQRDAGRAPLQAFNQLKKAAQVCSIGTRAQLTATRVHSTATLAKPRRVARTG